VSGGLIIEYRARFEGEWRASMCPTKSRVFAASNAAVIATDTVALLFPTASVNGVSIRVTRSLHSHVAPGECYKRRSFDSHSSAPPATGKQARLSIVFPMSFRDDAAAFMHMHAPAAPA